jgi:hypothetical protein
LGLGGNDITHYFRGYFQAFLPRNSLDRSAVLFLQFAEIIVGGTQVSAKSTGEKARQARQSANESTAGDFMDGIWGY